MVRAASTSPEGSHHVRCQKNQTSAATETLFGGGAADWAARGRAQLSFLRAEGLKPHDHLLDLGCGPLRAGIHIVEYLDPACYCGIDYNSSFIDVARSAVSANGLEQKRPTLAVIEDFRVASLHQKFDWALAFSVLNHCDGDERAAFFRNLPSVLVTNARVFVTHGKWFKEGEDTGKLRLRRRLNNENTSVFDTAWSSEERETLFPILEFALSV